jgi:alpha-mannosidase
MIKNREPVPWDRELDYSSSEVPFMFSSDEFKYEHGFIAAGKYVVKEDKFKDTTQQFVKNEVNNFPGNIILAMNGMDTCFPSLKGLMALEKVKRDEDKDYELIYSSLDQFSAELKEAVNHELAELQQHKGEMRHFLPGFGGPQKSELKSTHFYLAAARPRQKSKNAKAENLLTRAAEPMAAMSFLLGKVYPEKYLMLAWKYLLKCHPHDTIAGCGADQIEIDMINRLDQTINISKAVLNFSLQTIVTNIDNSDVKDNEIALVVFNLSPFSRKEVVDLWLHVPDKMGFRDIEIVEKQKEKALNFDIVKRGDKEDRIFRDLTDTTLYVHGELVNVKVEVEIGGLGYQTLLVRGAQQTKAVANTLVTGEHQMENEYIKVMVNQDGTFNVQNKENGKEFDNLHYFTDAGDNGDPWVRFVPDQNHLYSTRGTNAIISLIEDSSLSAAFKIEYNFMIPKGLKKENYNMEGFFDKAESSSELVPLKVSSVLTLTKSSKYVDIQTEIDNRSTDHLVQVNFPSGLNTQKVYAESAFDVVERSIISNEKNIDPSLVNGEDPMIRFVDISDDKNGVAIISDSVKGYEALGDSENTIALNLIRAYTSQIVTIYGRKERRPDFGLTQAQGIQKFHYAIYPHVGNWENGCLKEAEILNYPLVPTQTHRSFGKQPCELNFVGISSPKLVLSAIKKAEREDAVIVRIYNPSIDAVDATLEMFQDIKSAEKVNLNEEVLQDGNALEFHGGKLHMKVGPKKIVTYKLKF